MNIQIAFNLLDLEQSIEVAKQIAEYCDYIEIGYLPLIAHGASIIKKFKEETKKTIVVDSKIIEKGEKSADLLFKNGADYITVMAGARKNVIHAVTATANNYGKKVMLDISDAGSPGQSALDAQNLDINAIIFHQVYNLDEPHNFLDKWEIVSGNTGLPIYISGKISKENIEKVLEVKPAGIILGKVITRSEDPVADAKFFYDLCKKN